MAQRYVLGCHHLAHPNIYRFLAKDGGRLRPWADTHEEGDEAIVAAHNAVVQQGDTIYMLGDVAIQARGLALLERMHGRKILVRGNHDIFKMKHYTPHFADIRATHKIGRLILSHYPIHRDSIPHWSDGNLHAHLHDRIVLHTRADGAQAPDPLYFNACLDRVGLSPIAVEDVEARMAANRAIQGRPDAPGDP